MDIDQEVKQTVDHNMPLLESSELWAEEANGQAVGTVGNLFVDSVDIQTEKKSIEKKIDCQIVRKIIEKTTQDMKFNMEEIPEKMNKGVNLKQESNCSKKTKGWSNSLN